MNRFSKTVVVLMLLSLPCGATNTQKITVAVISAMGLISIIVGGIGIHDAVEAGEEEESAWPVVLLCGIIAFCGGGLATVVMAQTEGSPEQPLLHPAFPALPY